MTGTRCAKARRGELQAVMGIPVDSHYLGPDWVYSQPFISVPNVIVSRHDSPALLGLSDLQDKRVLLSDPERVRGYVLQQAPQARIVAARSAEQAMQRLIDGEADAYVGNLALVDHLLRTRFPGRLQVAAPAGFNDQLALAVERRHAALATTFDRLLLQMTPREREALRGDWLAVEYHNGIDWRSTLRWGVPLLLVLLTALLVHGIGYWRLRREVAGRRQLEQRLAEVTDNLPAVVYQARREVDGTLSFPFIAGDLQALFGITRQQAEQDATMLLERVEEDDRARILQVVEQAAHQFAPLMLEFRLRGDGAGPRWVRTQAQPYAAEAGVVTWSGYWVDASEARAQADALTAAKAEAEQAAEAKSRFLATMSHEIRTPMSGVLGMLEVLAHSPLDAEQKRILGVIEDSAQMLRQILDDILTTRGWRPTHCGWSRYRSRCGRCWKACAGCCRRRPVHVGWACTCRSIRSWQPRTKWMACVCARSCSTCSATPSSSPCAAKCGCSWKCWGRPPKTAASRCA